MKQKKRELKRTTEDLSYSLMAEHLHKCLKVEFVYSEIIEKIMNHKLLDT